MNTLHDPTSDTPALLPTRRRAWALAAASLALVAGQAIARDVAPAPDPQVVEVELDTDCLYWDLCVGKQQDAAARLLAERIAEGMSEPDALYVISLPQLGAEWMSPGADTMNGLHDELINRRQLALYRSGYESQVESALLNVLGQVEELRPGARLSIGGFRPMEVRNQRGEFYDRLSDAFTYVTLDEGVEFTSSREFDRWLSKMNLDADMAALVRTSEGWVLAGEDSLIDSLAQPLDQSYVSAWPDDDALDGPLSSDTIEDATGGDDDNVDANRISMAPDGNDSDGSTAIAHGLRRLSELELVLHEQQLAMSKTQPLSNRGEVEPPEEEEGPDGGDGPDETPGEGEIDPPEETPGESGGAVPVLQPGPGFASAYEPAVAAIGSPSDFGYDMKAIARWNVVPYQDVSGPFELGVIAAHANGIEQVLISVNGGEWAVAGGENTDSGEYLVTLDPSLFPSDGEVELRAKVYPKDAGIPRVLAGPVQYTSNTSNWYGPEMDAAGVAQNSLWSGEHSLSLFVNAHDTLDVQVRELDAGEYVWGQPPLASAYGSSSPEEDGLSEADERRWTIFRAKPGVDPEDIVIVDAVSQRPWRDANNNAWNIPYDKVKLEGLTVRVGDPSDPSGLDGRPTMLGKSMLWLDNCRVVGPGQWVNTGGFSVSHGFFTDTYFSDFRSGTGYYSSYGSGNFVRGCTFERIGEKAIRAAYFVADTTVDGVDAGATNWHSSVISNPIRHDNRVYSGLRLSNINAKAFAFRSEEWNYFMHRDVLIGDVTVAGNPGGSYLMYLGGTVDNMVVRNSTFDSPSIERSWAYRLGLEPGDPRLFQPESLVFANVRLNGQAPDADPEEGVYVAD